MKLGLGLGLQDGVGDAAFSPTSISGISAWYDPSDLTTLFQDSAGTTPVTADGDPVGKMLDKSGNGNHVIQATAGLRPLYKTSGGPSWLLFDGADDALKGSLTLSGTSLTAWAAVRDLTGLASRRVLSLSAGAADFDGTNRAAAILTYSAAAGFSAYFNSAEKSFGTIAANSDAVIQSRFNNTDHVIRINGTDKSAVAAVGTFAVTNIGLGQQATGVAAGDCCNMRFYGGGLYSTTLTAGQKASLDTWAGVKAGIVL